MKRFLLVLAALVAAVAVTAPVAAAGAWLSKPAGKAEITRTVAQTKFPRSTRFASLVDTCYKPRHDRVSCFWQSREWYRGSWYICFGIAVATDRWDYVAVNLGPHWPDNCYPSYDPTFV